MKKMKELTISVVGVGQIGGSFALALKKNRIGKKIIGVDKLEVIDNPRIRKYVDHATFDLKTGIENADFIFLSTSLLTIFELLPRIISHMKPDAVLLDSGSTKKEISQLMRKYPEKILIGGHPMAGTENAGLEAASPTLFQNRIFAFTFPTRKSRRGKKTVMRILKKIEALPLEIDDEKHDFYVSLASHLPYVLSLSLTLLSKDFVKENSLLKKFMASGFHRASGLSLTREEMGRGILSTNTSQIVNMMDEFSERFKKIKKFIENGNDEDLLYFLSRIRSFQSELIEKDESTR